MDPIGGGQGGVPLSKPLQQRLRTSRSAAVRMSTSSASSVCKPGVKGARLQGGSSSATRHSMRDRPYLEDLQSLLAGQETSKATVGTAVGNSSWDAKGGSSCGGRDPDGLVAEGPSSLLDGWGCLLGSGPGRQTGISGNCTDVAGACASWGPLDGP